MRLRQILASGTVDGAVPVNLDLTWGDVPPKVADTPSARLSRVFPLDGAFLTKLRASWEEDDK